jgi:hypothetical protein
LPTRCVSALCRQNQASGQKARGHEHHSPGPDPGRDARVDDGRVTLTMSPRPDTPTQFSKINPTTAAPGVPSRVEPGTESESRIHISSSPPSSPTRGVPPARSRKPHPYQKSACPPYQQLSY